MATVPVVNWKRERVGEVDLPADVFEYPYRRHLVWEVVKAYRAGQRAGTHKTKVRSEVSGSGRKPFKQKGTGRARQGGSRPPIHRHGGTAHGPRPRSYAQGVSVGEKKNALKSVLSRRVKEERLVVIDHMDLESHRTRELVAAVGGLGVTGKALFVVTRENESFSRASRNVGEWKVVDPLGMNVYDVMNHGTLVLSRTALSKVVATLGGE
ncbi:MAG: 50S ribosomal protein L4 [Acidobacteriota bacterium]|nr:50S ribosomal protein L4 [Acidobacteriota bacterium]MDQ2978877.1 50S ribosomal protein L4 [Acidobacteriota bacterium]